MGIFAGILVGSIYGIDMGLLATGVLYLIYMISHSYWFFIRALRSDDFDLDEKAFVIDILPIFQLWRIFAIVILLVPNINMSLFLILCGLLAIVSIFIWYKFGRPLMEDRQHLEIIAMIVFTS